MVICQQFLAWLMNVSIRRHNSLFLQPTALLAEILEWLLIDLSLFLLNSLAISGLCAFATSVLHVCTYLSWDLEWYCSGGNVRLMASRQVTVLSLFSYLFPFFFFVFLTLHCKRLDTRATNHIKKQPGNYHAGNQFPGQTRIDCLLSPPFSTKLNFAFN